MKAIVGKMAATIICASIIIQSCTKTSPLPPSDGGNVRLSKIYHNGTLLWHYEYNDTGRLLRMNYAPALESKGKLEFEYDDYGRIKQYLWDADFTDTYTITEVLYDGNDEVRQKNEKTFRKASNALIVQRRTDIRYELIPIGRKIIAVEKTVPEGDILERTIFHVYWNSTIGRLYGNVAEEHTLDSREDTTYSRYYRYSTSDDLYKPDINALSPFTYTNTYGWEIVKSAPNVPASEISNPHISYDPELRTHYHHQYTTDENNLIVADKETYLLYEELITIDRKYEYIRVK